MAHRQSEYKQTSVPVDRQKQKIHGGHAGARVDFGGDREPAGGSRGTVDTHDQAAAMHSSKGMGSSVIDARLPDMDDPDCPGPY